MLQARPAKWTGMIAFVLGVIARRTCSGSILKVSRSTSTRTGVAPAWMTLLTVAAKVIAGTMTSSPGLELEREARQMQTGRAGIDSDGVRRALVYRDPLLEFRNLRARPEPSGAKAFHDLFDFRFLDQRLAENQIGISHIGLSEEVGASDLFYT